jgi:hypothetical protein
MAGPDDDTRVVPGRMASAELGPDYATLDEEGPQNPYVDYATRFPARAARLTETKPFFLTSEFFGTLAVLAALAVTAASSDALDADLMWPLATGIVAAYIFSRGFSKGGAPSHAWDPRETFRGFGGGDGAAKGRSDNEEVRQQMSTVTREEYGSRLGSPMYGVYGRGIRQSLPVETKPFFLTSEFWGSVALIVALAIAAGTSDVVDARLFWILATAVTIGYVVSRGIAKSGTKSQSWDPRDDLMQAARERMGHGQGQGQGQAT